MLVCVYVIVCVLLLACCFCLRFCDCSCVLVYVYVVCCYCCSFFCVVDVCVFLFRVSFELVIHFVLLCLCDCYCCCFSFSLGGFVVFVFYVPLFVFLGLLFFLCYVLCFFFLCFAFGLLAFALLCVLCVFFVCDFCCSRSCFLVFVYVCLACDVVVDISRLLVLLCFGGIRLLVKLFSTLFCCWQYCVWGVILLVHPFLERVVLSVLLVVFVLLCAC